jgi:hypothetical protein
MALTDEEWEARRAAAVRARDAIAALTGQTGTDGTWCAVFRRIDAGRPHRRAVKRVAPSSIGRITALQS